MALVEPGGRASHDLRRLHSLDALRAAMMLLGLVLHSAVSYTATPLGAAWPYQDRQTSALFDWLVFFVHLFRMPTFFVMAGFFAAFLYYREGAAGFLSHRIRRLLLPLAAAWVVVFPLVSAGFVYAAAGGGSTGLAPALARLGSTPYARATLVHLWFIYYLMIFCVAAAVIVPLIARISEDRRQAMLTLFARLAPTMGGCLLLGLVTAASLVPMEKSGLDTSTSFLPAARVLIAYAVFFVFGWLVFARRDLVSTFGRHPVRYAGAGLVVGLVYLTTAVGKPLGETFANHMAAIGAAGIATWLLVYGVTGLFVRHFEAPRPLQRYLSDAAYWMYLIHLPFTIWISGLLAPVAVPAVVKFVIVLGATTLVTVTTYHFFVRATAIGAFLNGRRFARALPAPDQVAGGRLPQQAEEPST